MTQISAKLPAILNEGVHCIVFTVIQVNSTSTFIMDGLHVMHI
jgi:hypothetical protein